MNKRLIKLICIALIALFSVVSLCACGDDGGNSSGPEILSNECKIVFVQEGYPNIVKTVKRGESLTDIPTPVVADENYEYEWDVKDFSYIESDMTVKAIKVRKYVVSLELGSRANDENAEISVYSLKFKKGDTVELPEPTCDGYEFTGWKNKKDDSDVASGVFNYEEDLTLVAQWELDPFDDRWVDLNGRI